MLNPYVIKKWAAILLGGFIPTISFITGIQFYNFTYAIFFFFGGLVASLLIGIILLKNPFSDLLEGKGLLVLDISSTGLIKPFVIQVAHPYVKTVQNGRHIEDVFDRNTVGAFKAPVKALHKAQYIQEGKKKGGITIELCEDDYNRARFGLFQYPVLIYNSQIDSIVTKDYLSASERETFSDHTILYLNHKMKELTTAMLNFGRYVVELTKPKSSIFQNKFFWIILLVGLLILGFLFAPKIIEVGGNAFSAGASAISSAGPVTPK